MLSESERDSLSDIVFNIDLANSFAQGIDDERFLSVVHRLVWGTVHEFLPALRVMAQTKLAAEGDRG